MEILLAVSVLLVFNEWKALNTNRVWRIVNYYWNLPGTAHQFRTPTLGTSLISLQTRFFLIRSMMHSIVRSRAKFRVWAKKLLIIFFRHNTMPESDFLRRKTWMVFAILYLVAFRHVSHLWKIALTTEASLWRATCETTHKRSVRLCRIRWISYQMLVWYMPILRPVGSPLMFLYRGAVLPSFLS